MILNSAPTLRCFLVLSVEHDSVLILLEAVLTSKATYKASSNVIKLIIKMNRSQVTCQ